MKINLFAATGLLVCLSFAVSPAKAQETCSLQTVVGTYAFQAMGSSAIVNLAPQVPPPPSYYAAVIAPFVTVGEVTFTPDGIGNGYYWIQHGSGTATTDKVGLEINITEMNPDCTGVFEYTVPGGTTIKERLIVYDQGREVRSLPISLQGTTVDPYVTWINVAHRIGKAGETIHSCGPETANGTYLTSIEEITAVNATTAFADRALMRIHILMSGEYTGKAYQKVGPVSAEADVSGTVTVVHPDCSFEGNMTVEKEGVPPFTFDIRGVFFDQGKGFFSLAVGAPLSDAAGQGVRISQ